MPSPFVKVFFSSLSRILIVLFVIYAVGGMTDSYVHAQSAGVSIKPALLEESIDPGNDKEHHVSIENLTDNEVTYYLFTLNIAGVKDGGVPVFAENNFERTGYELADWIELSTTEVTIPARESFSLPYIIRVPENASPCSHLGGVFVSVEPPKLEESGAAVGYKVASLINIRVAGECIEEGVIRQFSTGKYLYGSQNVDFKIRIENKGNVVIKPVGPLEIKNMLGNKVATVMFNEEQAAILPKFYDDEGNEISDGMREFSNVVWEGNSVGFGRYEAILSASYGDLDSKKTMSNSVTFWILPMNIIGPALGVLAVILLVVFVFVRLYIKRSLAHLNQGRRLVRRRKKGGSAALLVTVVMLTATALFLIVLLALFA